MAVFESAQAAQVKQTGGTLKGYLPFKSSDEPITLSSGWDKIGVKMPASPPPVVVNQETGDVVSMEDFLKNHAVTLPEEVSDKMVCTRTSIQSGKELVRFINQSLLET